MEATYGNPATDAVVVITIFALVMASYAFVFYEMSEPKRVPGTDTICESDGSCPRGTRCISRGNGGLCLTRDYLPCVSNANCASGKCLGLICQPREVALGGSCLNSLECSSGYTCDRGTCKAGIGGTCSGNSECSSGTCTNGVCSSTPTEESLTLTIGGVAALRGVRDAVVTDAGHIVAHTIDKGFFKVKLTGKVERLEIPDHMLREEAHPLSDGCIWFKMSGTIRSKSGKEVKVPVSALDVQVFKGGYWVQTTDGAVHISAGGSVVRATEYPNNCRRRFYKSFSVDHDCYRNVATWADGRTPSVTTSTTWASFDCFTGERLVSHLKKQKLLLISKAKVMLV